MTTSSTLQERVAFPTLTTDGSLQYAWNLSDKQKTDPVVIQMGMQNVLPIVFVPGIMGSNLCAKDNKNIKPWRLDTSPVGKETGLAGQKFNEKAGARQRTLHPARTEVDPGGNVPDKAIGSIAIGTGKEEFVAAFRARGWGEVGERSYHAFLSQLEKLFNGHRRGEPKTAVEVQIAELFSEGSRTDWHPQKQPLIEPNDKDALNLHRWSLPVYACGYNWLDDNAVAARRLSARIKTIIAGYNNAYFRCEQVIVVTHSMGGLVARACQQLDGMADKIAGVVHGVMPANGAAVAYRRCKVGLRDEDAVAAVVIGRTGQEVTAVFAQAPGALQLLPTARYAERWLEVRGPDAKAVQKILPESKDPHTEIYRRRDRWWALIKEEWLAPKDGMPVTWEEYLKFLKTAEDFHRRLTPNIYHPNTYAFYGGADAKSTDNTSFERIVWQMKRGQGAKGTGPAPDQVYGMNGQQLPLKGSNPEYVGWQPDTSAQYNVDPDPFTALQGTSQWELLVAKQDSTGDGTVPASSGRAPADCAKVRQVFRLNNVVHEGVYRESVAARQVTVYAISKIALVARVPASTPARAGVKA